MQSLGNRKSTYIWIWKQIYIAWKITLDLIGEDGQDTMTMSTALFFLFFSNYTIETLKTTHTHPYEYTHANPTPKSIFEDCVGKSSRLTKSPQAPRCRRKRRLPLKAQTPLNPEKFAPTRSRTQDLRCYRGSCNH
jgi:hypothetical protein